MKPPRERDRPLHQCHAELSGVRVAYADEGAGEPILLVHGIPTSSYLWRNVIRALSDEYRLVAPDLMGLGHTETPLDHRYDMAAQADKLLELADHLGLDGFTLVCHDQGGAAAQWLAVHHPKRLRRFVITNCVCYDNWPVPLVASFMKALSIAPAARLARRLGAGRAWARSRVGLRLGVHDPAALSNDAIDEYFAFEAEGPERFEQFRRFALSGHPRYTLEAAKRFGALDVPTLVVWATEDRWLSASWAKRLANDIAGTRGVELVPFAGHFWQEEKPVEVAEHIRRFMRSAG